MPERHSSQLYGIQNSTVCWRHPPLLLVYAYVLAACLLPSALPLSISLISSIAIIFFRPKVYLQRSSEGHLNYAAMSDAAQQSYPYSLAFKVLYIHVNVTF